MPEKPPAPASRRPLASRDTGWARVAASRLAASRVTPNQISIASVGFAALGFLLFWASSQTGPWTRGALLILAAVAVQLRLLCNLLDGMVAVEGGRGAPDGPFWNEAPDRLADILLLGGAGIAAGAPVLGCLLAVGAVGTAYLRELGRAEGLPADFSGPMAKPHRMAALTVGAVIGALEPLIHRPPVLLRWTLWLILAGLLVTLFRRSRHILTALRRR